MGIKSFALAATALVLSTTANAALIDNGTSMIDTGTGLEWLDLTETDGLSVSQVLLTSFVTVGGYVHATDEQVQTMFTNAGFFTPASTASASNDAAAADLLSFLGCTQFCGIADRNATGRGFADWNGLGTYTRAFYKEGPLGASYATTSLLTSDLDLVDVTAGHFLVRAVPIPAAVWLFGSGLIGIIGVARKKKS